MATATDALIDALAVVERADAVPGPGQGEWTYADYAAIPDDGRRYEVVNGVLYMAPRPVERHQAASMRIGSHFFTHIEAAGLGRVYAAPFDVELSPENVVQPDVIVVLKDNLQVITAERIIGAPDLVVEIASPSTATHDRDRKRRAYEQAGVREYWIADHTPGRLKSWHWRTGSTGSWACFKASRSFPPVCCRVCRSASRSFLAERPPTTDH